MKPPRKGDTVIYYQDGTTSNGCSGVVTRVYDSGWMVDIELKGSSALIRAVSYAPPQSMINGKRARGTWDFVA